jgi:dihydroorotate dehydrogenase (fumarate)
MEVIDMLRRIPLKVVRYSYTCLAKPILFAVPPDKAHGDMISSTSKAGRVRFHRNFVKFFFDGRQYKELAQKYHGIEFKSPVGLSAGFDKNGEIVPMIARLGFGFGTVGSVTALECKGNPRPWFYRLPKTKSMVINAGLANHGSSVVIDRINDYDKEAVDKFPIVLSVAKTNSQKVVSIEEGIEDYAITIKRARDESRIAMIELNISCPNAFGGEPFTTPERLDKLLAAIDKLKVKKPVIIKMPIDQSWSQFKKLLDVIVRHKVTGVTVGNLAKDRSKAELLDELPDTVRGNLSGMPTKKLNNELIRRTYLDYGDKLIIIGVGGIFSAEDAYEKIRLGASLVELITGMMFCGPQLVAEINDGLARLLARDGYTNISQAIGVDACNKDNR